MLALQPFKTYRSPTGKAELARRRTLAGTLAQAQREATRVHNAKVRAQAVSVRDYEKALKSYEKAQAADEKERKRLYAVARSAEVDASNDDLDEQIKALETLLTAALGADAWVDFEALKTTLAIPPFRAGTLGMEEAPPNPDEYRGPQLSEAKKLVPGAKARHEATVAETYRRYWEAVAERDQRETVRLSRLAEAMKDHDTQAAAITAETDRQNSEIDEFRTEFEAGNPEAIVSYFDLVLQASPYPESFTRRFRLAYVPESRQLVVEFELSPIGVIPTVRAYRYVKARDEVTEAARPASQIKSLYQGVVAQSTLRTLHEVFQADRVDHVETVVFNGLLDTVDRATGKPVRPCLVTVRTTKQAFGELDLANVEPAACLKHLGANVSRSPTELLPVRPVLEFDMVDKRFVQETDVLSTLDERPNLMELTPSEFENLITNLFTKMGLDTRQTQPSRDGGVDCVAFDPRPIFGGKVVIQAKRYKGTVGVSAIRDLYGTVHNEGASKGILVATSGYGRASFEFANGKPLELLDGSNLLYLLQTHAGIEARIEPPDDWVDPASAILA